MSNTQLLAVKAQGTQYVHGFFFPPGNDSAVFVLTILYKVKPSKVTLNRLQYVNRFLFNAHFCWCMCFFFAPSLSAEKVIMYLVTNNLACMIAFMKLE